LVKERGVEKPEMDPARREVLTVLGRDDVLEGDEKVVVRTG
jgi:hypothetical protein